MNINQLLITTLQMQKKITERRIKALNELPLSEITNALTTIELATLEVVNEELEIAKKRDEVIVQRKEIIKTALKAMS